MKKNIFVALDFNSLEKDLNTTEKIKAQIAGVKIGTELYAVCGTEGLKKFRELGVEIFLDLKLMIFLTSQKNRCIFASLKNVKYLTVHTSGNLKC